MFLWTLTFLCLYKDISAFRIQHLQILFSPLTLILHLLPSDSKATEMLKGMEKQILLKEQLL